jgi:hypothetical protein
LETLAEVAFPAADDGKPIETDRDAFLSRSSLAPISLIGMAVSLFWGNFFPVSLRREFCKKSLRHSGFFPADTGY